PPRASKQFDVLVDQLEVGGGGEVAENGFKEGFDLVLVGIDGGDGQHGASPDVLIVHLGHGAVVGSAQAVDGFLQHTALVLERIGPHDVEPHAQKADDHGSYPSYWFYPRPRSVHFVCFG